ncbi:MAG: trigger factor [Acidimicrobiales bacterium]
MKASVEPLEGNKVKLSVEVDESEFDKAVDAVFRQIAREVRIPGFRPGKAPRRLLEARVGTEYAREQALRDAVPEYYSQAVRDHEVDVIAAPEINITSGESDGPVAFDAVVEIRPQIMVPGYGGLRVTLPRPVATEAEIDAQIQRLREQFGELAQVDRPAIDGDHVTLSLAGTRDGEPVSGLNADDFVYEVGRGFIAEGLDAQLRGSKVGDVLEFSAEPAGTDQGPVDFRVLVKDVKERILPDVDDEWANEVSEFETVDELRADFATRLSEMRRAQAALELRERTIGALVELVEEDAPEPLVNQETRNRLDDLGVRLQGQGITAEQWLSMTGRTEQELLDELRTVAVRSVKADLALRAVADAEEIEALDDEIDAEFEQLSERMGQKANRLRREFERMGSVDAVRTDVRKGKALDWLVDRVEIVDDEGQPIDRADLETPDDDADPISTTDDVAEPTHLPEDSDEPEAADERADTVTADSDAPTESGDETQ